MTDKQLKAILTMLALPMIGGVRIVEKTGHGIPDGYEIARTMSEDERLEEAEKLAEKVMGR